MDWSEITKPSTRVLRQFGVASLALLMGLAIWQGVAKQRLVVAVALAASGLIFALLAWLAPIALRIPYVVLSVLLFPIGWIVTQVILGAIFLGFFTPLGLFFRMRGRDLLRRKRSERDSYFSARTQPTDLRSYFRQF